MDRADLVLLPTDAEPSRQMKSANRLERALWAGRLPIAMSCPVADAYADSAIVADDLGMGIRRALADPAAWQARIAEGQARVAETRTGQVLAPLWEAAFLKAL